MVARAAGQPADDMLWMQLYVIYSKLYMVLIVARPLANLLMALYLQRYVVYSKLYTLLMLTMAAG